MSIIALLIVLFMILGIAVTLQIYLSKRENKWLGLILPVICIIFSIVTVIGFVAFNNVATTIDENGGAATQIVEVGKEETLAKTSSMVLGTGMILLIYNVPTLIFFIIYFVCREKYKKKLQLEKMNIQDLE